MTDSLPSRIPQSDPHPIARGLAALLPLGLLVLSVLLYLDDRRARVPIVRAAKEFTLDVRRPLEVEMIGYAPAADIGTQVLAILAVSDALGRIRLKGLDQVERDAWLDVPAKLDDELAVSRDLTLDAIAARPGWPMHRYLLGKLTYTADRRGTSEAVIPDRWLVPLRSAAAAAPGEDNVAETLGAVTLEGWNVLPEAHKRDATAVLARSFEDASFVRKAWAVSADAIGTDAATRAVPDSPEPLRAAASAAASISAMDAATSLYRRWEAAEWHERELDLMEMRVRREHGDWQGLITASRTWVAKHAAGDFDTPQAREQLEELLHLWPKDQVSTWAGEPRNGILRYFLEGRMRSVDGTVLADTAGSLSGVPEPVLARVWLAAGLVESAEGLARRSVTKGTFEWTSYFVDLARYYQIRGDKQGALDALSRIAPAAQGECDVEVARSSLRDSKDSATSGTSIAVTDSSGAILPEAWSSNGMLALCVDPRSMAARTLVVELRTETPALVEWGWNDARSATVPVPEGAAMLRIPLKGFEGRNVLYVRAGLGGKVVSRAARME